jgi:MFS family permease
MKKVFTLQQRILLWLACSAIFFEAFDVSIVNLALPLIATDLRKSSLYTVGTGVGLSLTGLCLRSFSHSPADTPLLAGSGVIGIICGAALWMLVQKKYLPLQPDLK